MGTVAKAPTNDGPSTPAPAGNHLAICFGVIDLGHQWQANFGKWQHEVLLRWELCDELMEDGRPFGVSRRFTLSLSEKSNLRALLKSWRGRDFTEEELDGFDLKNILGKPCMLTVIHKPGKEPGKVWANVVSAAPLPKRAEAPEMVNPLVYFDIDTDGSPPAEWPAFIRKAINESRERGGQGGRPDAAPEPTAGDCPF